MGERNVLKNSELLEMIKKDSEIDNSEIAEENIKVIALHAKYLGLHQEEKRLLKIIEEEVNKLKLKKMEYYLGRSPDQVYRDNPLNIKIPRQDLDFYLDADDELCELKRKMNLCQSKVDLLRAFIDQNLNQRSHWFRNAINFLNFSVGK